jgi:hypothetical protein
MPEFPIPKSPKSDAAQISYLILKYAHDTAESLLEAYNTVVKGRGRGAPTHEEQDLLRAMVVFAGAGIDAMTKRLIRDALPVLVETSAETRTRMEQYVARHLRRVPAEGEDVSGEPGQSVSPQRLARVLLADEPRRGLMDLLTGDLTAGSLQSAAELYRVLGYFGLPNSSIGAKEADLREVFECRNRIIHEMDIDFGQPRRNRRPRRREDMVAYTRILLTASASILEKVDSQLPTPTARPRGRPRKT